MSIFDKQNQREKTSAAPEKQAAERVAGAVAAPKTAEMEFSEALISKSGSAAVAALEKAQPEERRSIAANSALMSTMKQSLDKKSRKACEKFLPVKPSRNPLASLWGGLKDKASNVLSDASDWLDGAKDSASDLISGAKDSAADLLSGAQGAVSGLLTDPKGTVSDFLNGAKDTATDLWNGAKETATGLYNDAKENVIDPAVDSAKAFIPQNVSNEVVVGAYDLMSRFTNTMSDKDIEQHRSDNAKTIGMDDAGNSAILNLDKDHQFIENQNDLEDIAYGKGLSNMSYSGCEIIATFNALRAVGENPKLEDLIADYEKNGMALNGQFGTAPGAILRFFQKEGFACEMLTEFSPESLVEFSRKYQTFIATVYNDENDITNMIHTVSITKDNASGSDQFAVHNAYAYSNNASDPRRAHMKVTSGKQWVALEGYASIEDAIADISKSSVKPITLIGINGKQLSDK
ncbi:MAG: hypothetical protein IJ165_13940 [Proteobacteria bacterium]|nr:hypothetical protein [Pseudomonadota bacterium]